MSEVSVVSVVIEKKVQENKANICFLVQSDIDKIVSKNKMAIDGGSHNLFPSFLDAVNQWHYDVQIALQQYPDFSKLERKMYRTEYFDYMYAVIFKDLRNSFINEQDTFGDDEL